MRVAIFTDTFFPATDGVVTSIQNYVKILAERGHNFLIIAPDYDENSKIRIHKNVKIIRIKSFPLMSYKEYRVVFPSYRKCLKEVGDFNADVVHIESYGTLGLLGNRVAKKLKIPLIGTFHTFFAEEQYLQHVRLNYRPVQRFAWAYSRFLYNPCDRVTCPSKSTRRELLKHKIHQRIDVISNGIDKNMFDNSQWKEVRKKYAGNSSLILFIGRVAHEKNILYLLDCFSMLLKKKKDVKLLIVGGGPQMQEVKDKIDSLGMRENVLLAGRIEHSKLVKSSIFKACDLFVTASVTENQPMTILEAQANGLPCVGIRAKGMKDLIRSGYNGYLVKEGRKNDFAMAIFKIISNKRVHKRMNKSTLSMIKEHDLEEVGNKWEKLFKDLARKN